MRALLLVLATSGLACLPTTAAGQVPGPEAVEPTVVEGPGPEARPNVLLVIVDDLRPALGCYGDALAITPHIDRIAEQGLVFERSYCQMAQCSPSRESLLSGLRPDTIRVYNLRTSFRQHVPDAVSLPQLFRQAGYETRAVGKVHHGTGKLDDPASWSEPPWRPEDWTHYHTDAGRESIQEAEDALRRMDRVEDPRGLAMEAPEISDDVLVDGQIAAEAVRILGEVADRPFFLAVGFKKPHLPFVAPKRYWDMYPAEDIPLARQPEAPRVPAYALSSSGELRAYRDIPDQGPIPDDLARELIRGYYACVTHVDGLVGRLMAELERLELDERTIVVVWGDHGYHLGELGQWTKFLNFEEATRSPLIVRVPGRAPGEASRALVEAVDLYPSLAELCGLDAPDDLGGTSFVPLLEDPGRPWKPAVFSQFPKRDGKRRLMGYTMRTDRYRITAWGIADHWDAFELYDYERDPLGGVNLANDPDHEKLRRELFGQLKAGSEAALPPEETAAPEGAR